jgi:hypothetical protein
MLCACGCGQETKITRSGRRNRYLNGHNGRGVPMPVEAREKIAASKRGKPRDLETKRKISASLQGRPSPHRGPTGAFWKEDATYNSIHRWLHKNVQKTGYCSDCGEFKGQNGRGTGTDWANISGTYSRDPSDYRELCRSCHIQFDKNRG